MIGNGHHAMEVAKTVLEVADVAWRAMECCEHIHNHNHCDHPEGADHCDSCSSPEQDLEALRSENRRLRVLLEENLKILQKLAQSPPVSKDCPPDLYDRIVDTVDSRGFLGKLETLHQMNKTDNGFPFKEATGYDSRSAELLINVDHENPSWWVWITDDMVPGNSEEWSGIDDENYVVVSEELVVDGVSNFIARCILANPKSQSLTPEELQKIVAKALHGVNKLEKMLNIWHAGKLLYTLSTWGLALTGLYRSRAILKHAARGAYMTSKVVLKTI